MCTVAFHLLEGPQLGASGLSACNPVAVGWLETSLSCSAADPEEKVSTNQSEVPWWRHKQTRDLEQQWIQSAGVTVRARKSLYQKYVVG